MQKYWQIIRGTWAEGLTYRLSFIIYRARSFLQLITMYFLWQFIVPSGSTMFGYSQSHILTYILGTSLIGSVVLSSRSQSIATDINEGNLSNFLIKPVNYFSYWFARDLGDKALNIIFSIGEIGLFFVLFHPPLFVQTQLIIILWTILSVILVMTLYFYFSVFIGLFGFWSNEVWGPRFIFYQLLLFLAGSLFPLDILPKPVFAVMQYLPFTYLLYFPLKLYLGNVSIIYMIQGIAVTIIWIGIMHVATTFLWKKGLKAYTAQGR